MLRCETASIQVCSCTSVVSVSAHESAAAFGDDIRFYRAITGTDVNDPDDVAAVLTEVTRAMPADAAVRTTSFLRTHGLEWARRADTGVCEVARDTARRLGLPESTQQALYHVYETWVGGWVPHGLKGDDIAVASRVARAAMEVAFFSQLGGADAAVAAVGARNSAHLRPRSAVDGHMSGVRSVLWLLSGSPPCGNA